MKDREQPGFLAGLLKFQEVSGLINIIKSFRGDLRK